MKKLAHLFTIFIILLNSTASLAEIFEYKLNYAKPQEVVETLKTLKPLLTVSQYRYKILVETSTHHWKSDIQPLLASLDAPAKPIQIQLKLTSPKPPKHIDGQVSFQTRRREKPLVINTVEGQWVSVINKNTYPHFDWSILLNQIAGSAVTDTSKLLQLKLKAFVQDAGGPSNNHQVILHWKMQVAEKNEHKTTRTEQSKTIKLTPHTWYLVNDQDSWAPIPVIDNRSLMANQPEDAEFTTKNSLTSNRYDRTSTKSSRKGKHNIQVRVILPNTSD